MKTYRLSLCQSQVDVIVAALMRTPDHVMEDNVGGTLTNRSLAEMLQEMIPAAEGEVSPCLNGLCI